jgi:cytoskeletal protein RodZ|tara:strand:+ start:2021 stop:2416 length:396 start_codon:yes stop_codon:yes gene_type:complete
MKESTINLTSNEQLPSVGTLLKEARIKSKLTIEQVATKLFSDPDIVEDLENDIFKKLGGNVYIKGYIRNYSKLLGLDSAVLIDLLTNQLELEEEKIVLPKITEHLVALRIIAIVSLILLSVTVAGMYVSHN